MTAQVSPAPSPRERTLREELRAVEARWPGWHIFLSDRGRVWAVSAHCLDPDGSGTTIDAGTPEGIARQIAEVEHNWSRCAA